MFYWADCCRAICPIQFPATIFQRPPPRCRHACKMAALALASAAAPASAVPRVCKRPRSTRRGHCTGPSGSPVEQMTGKCVGRVGRVGHGMLPAATPWDTPATSVDRQPWKRREWVEAPRLPSPTPFPTHTHTHTTRTDRHKDSDLLCPPRCPITVPLHPPPSTRPHSRPHRTRPLPPDTCHSDLAIISRNHVSPYPALTQP